MFNFETNWYNMNNYTRVIWQTIHTTFHHKSVQHEGFSYIIYATNPART